MHCCWTCGDEAPTTEKLFEHMRSSHQDGVDWIQCPACDQLVVDMIAHYAWIHPGASIPGGTQLKITGVYRNYRAVKAREAKKKTRGKYREGFYESAKNGKKLHYRSSWELDCYRILENSFAVKSYHAEPFPITYSHGGSIKNYWPDILVVFIDDGPGKPSRVLIEVKPLAQCPNKDGKVETLEQSKNDAKWTAADNFCRTKGVAFVVWTERSIVRLAKYHKDALTKAVFLGSDDQS